MARSRTLSLLAFAAFVTAVGCDRDEPAPVSPIPDLQVVPDSAVDVAVPGDGLTDPLTDDTTAVDTSVDAGPELPEPQCSEATVAVDCQDLDTCTEDRCVQGQCVNSPIPGCCKTDDACDDGVPCTVDSCNVILKQCQFLAGSNLCCLTASDCDDGEACTDDLCAAHQCVFLRRTSDDACVCSSNIQCDDGSDCTTDSCSDGECQHEPTSDLGCCAIDETCDDGLDATFDACQYGSCWNAALPCEVDEDCASTDACLTGACTANLCTFSPLETPPGQPQCCTHDALCDDGLEATTDVCVNGQCVHRLGTEADACASDTDCNSPNPCVASVCATTAGQCSYTFTAGPGCCTELADCPVATDSCTAPICEDLICDTAALVGEQPWWVEEFGQQAPGAPIEGWTVIDDGSGARWQIGGAQAISAPSSLYYGALPAMNYDVGTTSGSSTSPLVTPPAGATSVSLTFWVAGDIEPITSSDRLWVEVLADETATVVWSKDDVGGLGTGWTEQTVDLSAFIGASFQLRFTFDSVDDVNNTGEGVYIDDVRLRSPCSPSE